MKKILILSTLFIYTSMYAQRGTTIPKENTPAKQGYVKPKTTPSQSSNTVILEVASETLPCSNNNTKQCLKIAKQGSYETQTVEDIENFNYEMGYTYKIQVKEIMKSPPIGINESVYRYVWVKTLEKKEVSIESAITTGKSFDDLTPKTPYQATNTNGKVVGQTTIQTNSILDGKWYLRKMKEAEGQSIVTDDNVMWVEINTFKDRLDGFGACNKFAAVVKSDLNTSFEVSKLTTNYTLCGNKKVEDLYYDLLQQADRFEIRNGNLILSKQWKYLLIFVSNPDNKEDINSTYIPNIIVKEEAKTYATDEKLKVDSDKYSATTTPIKTEEQKSTISTTSTSSTTATTIKTPPASEIDPAIEAKNKEIEELKRQLAEQQKPISNTKPELIQTEKSKSEIEQERLEQEAIELKKQIAAKKAKEEAEKAFAVQQQAEAKKQAELDKIKLEKQKEIEELKKQLAEKEKEANSIQPSINSTKEINNTIPQKITPSNTLPSSNVSQVKSKEYNSSISESALENVVYYMNGNTAVPLDRTNATYKGSSKNSFLEIPTEESTLQYHQRKMPQLYIKLDENTNPIDYLQLHVCDFIKNKRTINLIVKKNTIKISLSKQSDNIYKINLPDNLEISEYAFITKTDYSKLDQVAFNSSTTQISCFGINEVEKNSENNSVESSNDCKPDKIEIDKITKEKKEVWILKLASSSVFADKANGRDQFIFYFQLIKIDSKQYFALVLQKTASMTSQLLGNEYIFEKGNKVLFGLADSKPYEMSITDVFKDKKIFESSHQVVTTHYLIHEINNDEVSYIKDLLTNKNIDAIRIILGDGTFINKDVKEKKSDKLIAKANCFFNAIEH